MSSIFSRTFLLDSFGYTGIDGNLVNEAYAVSFDKEGIQAISATVKDAIPNNPTSGTIADSIIVDLTQPEVLDVYYDKVIKSDIYLKVENTSGKENKIFEATVSVPGDSLVVKKVCKSFEEGVDSAVNSLERQLKKRKEKLRAHL